MWGFLQCWRYKSCPLVFSISTHSWEITRNLKTEILQPTSEQIRLLTGYWVNYVRIILVLEVLSYAGFRRLISRDKSITVTSAAPCYAAVLTSLISHLQPSGQHPLTPPPRRQLLPGKLFSILSPGAVSQTQSVIAVGNQHFSKVKIKLKCWHTMAHSYIPQIYSTSDNMVSLKNGRSLYCLPKIVNSKCLWR